MKNFVNTKISKYNRYASNLRKIYYPSVNDIPQLSYVHLLNAYNKVLHENKHLRKLLKNKVPKIPKQHINYKKLNKSIDDFKELVDRS